MQACVAIIVCSIATMTVCAGVRRGYYAFEGPDWYSRSVWSKDLIQKLLTLNPARR